MEDLSIVIASGTFAVVRFSPIRTTGRIEIAANEVATKDVALGHARFIAPHVTNWTIEVAA